MTRFCLLVMMIGILSGCATPVTTLKNPKTGQVATCGGGRTASMAGGMIGYGMQKDDDKVCVDAYKNQGFKVIETKGE